MKMFDLFSYVIVLFNLYGFGNNELYLSLKLSFLFSVK